MARNGPLLTLAGGGVLAAVLLVASINAATRQDGAPDDALAADATPTAEATATPAATAAAAESPEPVEQVLATYVGRVDGGGAAVAVVIDGEQATGYVCDGTVEAWLNGTARNGELLLEGEDGSLTGSYDDTLARGRATFAGREWTFAIEYVAPPEGLFRVADTVLGGAEVEGGWIVLPDGSQVGLLTVDGESRSAPALDPDTGQVRVGGQTVTAERQG